MLKSALVAAVIGFAFIAPAYADDAKCDEPTLTAMKVKIDAMTNKEKQTTTIAMWEKAEAAMKANNMDECTARMGDTTKNMEEQSN